MSPNGRAPDMRLQEMLDAGYQPEQILSCPKRRWIPESHIHLCPCQMQGTTGYVTAEHCGLSD